MADLGGYILCEWMKHFTEVSIVFSLKKPNSGDTVYALIPYEFYACSVTP